VSPASLRRDRAERLLREEFRALRACVLASARGSLRACGAELDESDLEACYAQAWQGLYAATLGGQRIVNPAGWLATVTFRRAIDEYRSRARTGLRDRTSQGSLMRGLAYGILDPAGERHRLALIHTSACPACRAYVASLRGLAALLPPAPSLLPLLLAGGAGAKATGLGAGLARGAAWGPGMEAASGGGAPSGAPPGPGAGGAVFGPGAMS